MVFQFFTQRALGGLYENAAIPARKRHALTLLLSSPPSLVFKLVLGDLGFICVCKSVRSIFGKDGKEQQKNVHTNAHTHKHTHTRA